MVWRIFWLALLGMRTLEHVGVEGMRRAVDNGREVRGTVEWVIAESLTLFAALRRFIVETWSSCSWKLCCKFRDEIW